MEMEDADKTRVKVVGHGTEATLLVEVRAARDQKASRGLQQ